MPKFFGENRGDVNTRKASVDLLEEKLFYQKENHMKISIKYPELLICLFCFFSINLFGQAPENDECTGATVIMPASFSASCSASIIANTQGATKSSPNPSCTSSLNHDDIWYSFQATAKSIVLRVFNATYNGTGKIAQIGVSLYEASCPSTSNNIVCSNIITAGDGYLIIGDLGPGKTYYLRFWSSSSTQFATFEFCMQEAVQPVNDDWLNALSVTLQPQGTLCNNTIQSSTVGATRSLPDPDCTQFNDEDIWYSFKAISNGISLNFSNATLATSNSGNGNLGYAVYKSPFINAETSLSCNPNIGSRSGSSLIGELEPGEIYYLRLFSYGTNNYIRFDFCLVDQPVIENDDCVNAINLPVTNGFCVNTENGDLANATTSAGFGSPACTALSSSEDVWFKAVVPASGNMNVQTFAVNKRINDLIMEVYSGNCGTLQLIGCYDDDGHLPSPSKGHPSVELKERIPAEVLYFRILGKGSINNGPFVIGAWDPSILPAVSPGGNCILASNITIDSLHKNQYRWVPVFDLAGNIFAQIYADGANPGDLIISAFVNSSGEVRNNNGKYYLDRNLTILPAKNISAKVRMYFSGTELAALQQVDPAIISADHLIITKKDSVCANIFTGSGSIIFPDTTVDYGSGHYIQFTVPAFSSFFLHSASIVLPLQFISFRIEKKFSTVQLTWQVVKENAIKYFEIQYGVDGINFQILDIVNKDEFIEEKNNTWVYQFEEKSNQIGFSFYRIKMIDINGKSIFSDVIKIKTGNSEEIDFSVYPNPVAEKLFIKSVSKPMSVSIELLNTTGQQIKKFGEFYSENVLELNLDDVADGIYVLKIVDKISKEIIFSRIVHF